MSDANTVKDALRNKKLAYILNFLHNLAFQLPIWVIFGTDYLEFSVSLIVAINLAQWLAAAALEIPTGTIADRFGRAKTYQVGVAIHSIWVIPYLITKSPLVILGGELLGALGLALMSGALLPLVHDSFKAAKISNDSYRSFVAREYMFTHLGRVAATLTGGMLYLFHPTAPYVALLITALTSVVLSLRLKEYRLEKTTAVSTWQQTKQAAQKMATQKLLVLLIVQFFFFNVIADALFQSYQPRFQDLGIGAGFIGFIYMCIAMTSALGSLLVTKRTSKFSPLSFIALSSVLVLISVFLNIAATDSFTVLFATLPLAIASGFSVPTINLAIVRLIGSQWQSTALSIWGMLRAVSFSVGSFTIARLIDFKGVVLALDYLLVAALVACIINISLAAAFRKRLKLDADEAIIYTTE